MDRINLLPASAFAGGVPPIFELALTRQLNMSETDLNYYEGMFVTKGGGGEDAWEQSRSAVKEVLEDHEATIDYIENWADQQFEKKIEKQRRGKYVLTYFQTDPSLIVDIKENTELHDRILRVLVLNREKEQTYRDMIQERIEANKEESEEEAETAEEIEESSESLDSEPEASDEEFDSEEAEPETEEGNEGPSDSEVDASDDITQEDEVPSEVDEVSKEAKAET